MKYRKLPVVIEAVLWNGNDMPLEKAPQWVLDAVMKTPGNMGNIFRHGNDLLIYTLEGTMKATPGDYIIKGVNGELYPCKPDIFEKTYKPADESPSPDPLAVNGWISVETALPEKQDRYLICRTYGQGRKEIFISTFRNDMNCFDDFLEDIITHWMPLPAIPKQVNEK